MEEILYHLIGSLSQYVYTRFYTSPMIQDLNRIKGIKGKSLKIYHTFASSLLDSPQMGPRFNDPTITVTWILVKTFTKSPNCHDGSMGQTVYFPT